MKIVNKILLKISEKLKKHKFFKEILNLEKLVENQRQLMYIVENMRFINDKIRKLKKF